MASNVLSPDQGGWKFWAGCGSPEPRLQPPGHSGLSWPAEPCPSLPGQLSSGPFCGERGSRGSEDPGVPPCTSALAMGASRARPNCWDLIACWPEELRVRPSPPVFFSLLFLFLAFFFSLPLSLLLSCSLLSVCLLFLSSLLHFFFLFHYFSSSFPLSCSRFLFHFSLSPFHLHFSFSLFLSFCSSPLPREPSPGPCQSSSPGTPPGDRSGGAHTPFTPLSPPNRGLPQPPPKEELTSAAGPALPTPVPGGGMKGGPRRCHVPAGAPRAALPRVPGAAGAPRSRPRRLKCGAEGRGGQRRGGGRGAAGSGGGGTGRTRPSGPTATLRLPAGGSSPCPAPPPRRPEPAAPPLPLRHVLSPALPAPLRASPPAAVGSRPVPPFSVLAHPPSKGRRLGGSGGGGRPGGGARAEKPRSTPWRPAMPTPWRGRPCCPPASTAPPAWTIYKPRRTSP